MKIIDFVSVHTVIPDLVSREKDAALVELAAGLAAKYDHLDQEKVLGVLQERERISSTAIGDGVAIPHGKLAGLDRIYGVFARSQTGVDFQSLDGEPTHLFFVLIAPENAAADHLKALARASRFFRRADVRDKLRAARGVDDLAALFASAVHSDAA